MKKKLLSILLVLVMVLSLLPAAALAEDEQTLKIVFDLRDFSGEYSGDITVGDKSYTPSAGTVTTLTIDSPDAVVSAYLDFMDAQIAYQSWDVSGINPDCLMLDDGYAMAYCSSDMDDYFLYWDDYCIYFEEMTAGDILNGLSGDTLTFTYKKLTSLYTVTASPSNQALGSATSEAVTDVYYKLTATAAEGSNFLYWRKDGTETNLTRNPLYVVALEDANYTAYFAQKATATAVVAEGQEELGTTAVMDQGNNNWIVSASAKSGCIFLYWINDNTGEQITRSNFTVTLTEDTHYTAYFKVKEVTAPVAEGQEEMGTTAVTVNGSYYTFTATPAEGYAFDYWESPDGEQIKQNPYSDVYVGGDAEYIAHFKSGALTFNIDLSAYEGAISGTLTIAGRAVTLEAGETYSFTLSGSDAISDDVITFESCAFATNWTVDGLQYMQRNQEKQYFMIVRGSKFLYFTTNTMYFQNGATAAELLTPMSGNTLTITYTPAVPQYSLTLTNAEGQENWGTVTTTFDGYVNGDAARGDQYRVATEAAEGKYFWYILKDGLEDVESNRQFFTQDNQRLVLTEDSSFTAHFRELFTATVQPEDESKGAVEYSVSYLYSAFDNITLTATPAPGYVFDYWEENGQSVSTNATCVRSLMDNGYVYVAHFKPMEMTGVPGGKGGIAQTPEWWNATTRGASNKPSAKPYVGGRAAVFIPFSINGQTAVDQIRVTLRGADDEVISVTDATANYQGLSLHNLEKLDAGSWTSVVMLDPFQADYATVTATVELVKDEAVIASLTQTYTTDYTDSVAENSDYSYKTFPKGKGAYDAYMVQPSPILHGVYTTVDDATGQLKLYAYGRGVYVLSADGETDFVELGGKDNSPASTESVRDNGVIGLGPDGEGGLAAVVKVDSNRNYITRYDPAADAWTTVEGSDFSTFASWETCAIVMSKDDVWTTRLHWDGASWTGHGSNYTSFTRASDGTAYATDSSGVRYVYDGTAWSQDDAPAAPSTASLAGLTVYGTYQDHNGDWYALTLGRLHRSTDVMGGGPSKGVSVFKWNDDDERWVYQIMSDFDDPEDCTDESKGRIRPDGPKYMEVPLDGVTVLYGKFAVENNSHGGFYLYTGNKSISFVSNGGSAVETLTAPIASKIAPPTAPTREGYTFVGWYTLNDFMTNGPSYAFGLMPATDLTLYAKWVEAGSGEDPFALERERATESLNTEYGKLTEGDYSADVWAQIVAAYEAGLAGIAEATSYDGVYAALNEAVDTIGALARQVSGTITVAVTVEKFTLDGEYIVEPTLIEVPRFAQASVVVTDLLKENFPDLNGGVPYTMTGTETDGFYLSGIYYYGDDGSEAYLAEKQHGDDSGWMYCVNCDFPGVGASSWSLTNGDVMRWQYTCYGLGADIGNNNEAFGGPAGIQVADKDALIWKIAEINAAGEQDEYPTYADAMAVLKDIPASQEAVDAALAALVKAQPAGPAAQIVSASLTLAGDIGVNFFVIPNDELLADEGAYAQLTAKGVTGDKIMLADLTPDNDGRFCFTQFVAAKEMTEQITLAIYTADGTAVALTDAAGNASDGVYSVARFVKAAGEFGSEKLQALAAKLASYGAYAKAYFEYEPVA
ncbi:MAG: InlB B-repeat-containing protein, partial [Oscillospiraceae bacterium]|nr:InlB B-repeat-containing protein [Oscillospiraceae bacterium]